MFNSGNIIKCTNNPLTKEGKYLLITKGHLYRVIEGGDQFIKYIDDAGYKCYSSPDRFKLASKLDIFINKLLRRKDV